MSRICYNGLGLDNTAALKNFLATVKNPLIKYLYLIGNIDSPNAIWATDHEAPLNYLPIGVFQNTTISRSNLTFKVGLDIQTCTITWAPQNRVYTNTLATANPLQLAAAHQYDMVPVRIWKVYMPTPGDCNTVGAVEWFGGVVSSCKVGRSGIEFSCKSYTYVLSQKTPANVIEVTNSLGGYTAVTAPPTSKTPVFNTYIGSTQSVILADCLTPTPFHVYGDGTFNLGFMVFLQTAGATLAGAWCVVGISTSFTDGVRQHSKFQVYAGLPFPPTPGVDEFYVSSAAPVNFGDPGYFGFPFVPNPESAA